jgi:hypothetical protein
MARKVTEATNQATGVSTVTDRHHMIAEAAYFRALARGFEGGDPLDDWLAAEQEFTRETDE